ncbi:MAG: hypothetical protein U5L46_07960 [Agrobacterium sp.]|nr:hypothetical protein [Agrobacterium sp.]
MVLETGRQGTARRTRKGQLADETEGENVQIGGEHAAVDEEF